MIVDVTTVARHEVKSEIRYVGTCGQTIRDGVESADAAYERRTRLDPENFPYFSQLLVRYIGDSPRYQ